MDTNAVSSLLAGDKELGRVLGATERHQLPLPVVGEYQFGLLALRKRERYQTLFRWLESECDLLFPDRETAQWYASIRYDLKRRGCPIPEGGLWIAALARQHEVDIVSRDEHFDLIRNVRRIGW